MSYGGQSVQLCALRWKLVVTLVLMVSAPLCYATALRETVPGRTQSPLLWQCSSLCSFHVPQTFFYIAAAL